MARPERNGVWKIRYYPPNDVAPIPRAGTWAHLNREDWIDRPHEAEPTAESARKAGIAS